MYIHTHIYIGIHIFSYFPVQGACWTVSWTRIFITLYIYLLPLSSTVASTLLKHKSAPLFTPHPKRDSPPVESVLSLVRPS